MSFTADQEALLDKIGVVHNAYAYFHVPTLVFEAPVAGYGNRDGAMISVVYGTPTVGSVGDIKPEMLVCIGFNGISDGGTQRVRGTDSGTSQILIGRSGFGHAEGQITPDVIGGTIRVYEAYHPFIKAPFITAIPEPLQYKDETLYPGDNAAQPPIANPGPDRLIITNASTYQLSFDALSADFPSVAVRAGATLASYLWDMGDGSYDSGTSASSNPVVTFPSGARYISLTVTDSNGVSHTAYRLIAVVPPEACTPIQIVSMTHTPEGNTLRVKMNPDLLPDGLLPRSKVMVAEKENYSDTSIIGYSERFSGWMFTETVDNNNPDALAFEFEIEDSAAFLQRNNLFPLSVNIAEGTGGWFAMPDANIDRLMHHILNWHTNILSLTGFKWSGLGTTYPFPVLTTTGRSVWENVKKLANAFAHQLTVDPYGQLRIVGDPHVLPSESQADDYILPTERQSGVVFTFTRDRYSSISGVGETSPRAYWLMAKGIVATNDFDNAAVVGCVAPSNAPNFGISDVQRADFLTIGQDELNVWAANLFAAGDGSPIGLFTLKAINPSMLLDLSKREYIAVELPDYILDRYDFDVLGNRWTVESVEYRYTKDRKEAIYTLKKEIVAVRPAHVLPQITEDDLIQAWDGFDESISPFTGDIVRGYDGMALTQEELEQTLSKTRLKVYLSEFETDSSGNTTGEGTDGGTGSVGSTDFDELSAVNGAYLNISREMDDFFERAQALYDGIAADPNVKTIFAQFVEASLLNVPTGAAAAWANYIVDTPDTTLPTFLVSDRFIHTSDMYCADSAPSGTTEYITEEITPTEWDRWFKATACISTEQYADWYTKGRNTPASLFQTYECYLVPPVTITATAAELDTSNGSGLDIVAPIAMNWESRWRASPDYQYVLVHLDITGRYETATHIKDAFYTVVKSTGVVTANKLSIGINKSTSPGVLTTPFTYPSTPAYDPTGAYSVVAYAGLTRTPSSVYADTRYSIKDTRTTITGGTGSISIVFTDLGRA